MSVELLPSQLEEAPEMVTFGKNDKRFVSGSEHLYRRLSVRECARIQTFPDNHIFYYNTVSDGYKMIGNAVPVEFAKRLAMQIQQDLKDAPAVDLTNIKVGKVISLSKNA